MGLKSAGVNHRLWQKKPSSQKLIANLKFFTTENAIQLVDYLRYWTNIGAHMQRFKIHNICLVQGAARIF